MQPTDESALLRRYAESHSEEAFAALVAHHLNLVYSVAFRQVSNPHNAEEITQAVFILLAKKAASLRHQRALSSWLFQTTRLTANNFIRSEVRRHRREQEAHVQSILNESTTDVWPKIAPLLDTAVAALREKDRQAILLRFYEGQNLREIGTALGATEAAAEKRVNRALEKLRRFFSKRGVSLSSLLIAGAISTHSTQAAPPTLAKSVTVLAASKGVAASASTTTLIQGTLKLMAWTKLKTAVIAGLAIVTVTGTSTLVMEKVKGAKPAKSEMHTLHVDKEVFIQNVMAQSAGTMNPPSVNASKVLMDMFRIQGVSKSFALSVNERMGKITVRNEIGDFPKIQQTMSELNTPDVPCKFATRVPVRQRLSFTARFYKASPEDYAKLLANQSWKEFAIKLTPAALKEIKIRAEWKNITLLSTLRLRDAYGIEMTVSSGSSTNVQLECLPMAFIPGSFLEDSMIDVRLAAYTTGCFNNNSDADWPDADGRTNCAFYVEKKVPDHGALLFAQQNKSGDYLMLLFEAIVDKK